MQIFDIHVMSFVLQMFDLVDSMVIDEYLYSKPHWKKHVSEKIWFIAQEDWNLYQANTYPVRCTFLFLFFLFISVISITYYLSFCNMQLETRKHTYSSISEYIPL